MDVDETSDLREFLRGSNSMLVDTLPPSLEVVTDFPGETVIIKIWHHNKDSERKKSGMIAPVESLLAYLRDINPRETDKYFSNVDDIHIQSGDGSMLNASFDGLLRPVEVTNSSGKKITKSRFTGITDGYIKRSFNRCDLIFGIGVLHNSESQSLFTLLAMNFVSICEKSGIFHLDGLCTNNIIKKDTQYVKFPKIGTRLMQFITDFARYAEYSNVFDHRQLWLEEFLCYDKREDLEYLATFEAVPELIAYYLKFGYIMVEEAPAPSHLRVKNKEDESQDPKNLQIIAKFDENKQGIFSIFREKNEAEYNYLIDYDYSDTVQVLETESFRIETTQEMNIFNQAIKTKMLQYRFLWEIGDELRLYNPETMTYDKEFTPFMFLPSRDGVKMYELFEHPTFNSPDILAQMRFAAIPTGKGIMKKKKKTYKYKNKRRRKSKTRKNKK